MPTIFDKARVMLPVRTACLDGLGRQNCIPLLRRKCIDEVEIPLILQVLAIRGYPVVDGNAADDPLVILPSEDEHLLSTPCFEDDYRRHLSCHQPPQAIGKGAGLANCLACPPLQPSRHDPAPSPRRLHPKPLESSSLKSIAVPLIR